MLSEPEMGAFTGEAARVEVGQEAGRRRRGHEGFRW